MSKINAALHIGNYSCSSFHIIMAHAQGIANFFVV